MNIYWDTQNHEFVKSLEQGQVVQRIDWIVRDEVPVTLYLVTPSDGDQAYTAYEAPSGWTIKFGIKHSGSLSGDHLVFQGTWTKDGAETRYVANINLNTQELIDALASAAKYDVLGEFHLQDASGTNRDSTQIVIRILPDVNRGDEATPTQLSPWWEEFTHAASGKKCLRIKNSDGETLAVLPPPGVDL